jgi:hypothetical protein
MLPSGVYILSSQFMTASRLPLMVVIQECRRQRLMRKGPVLLLFGVSFD